MSNQTKVSFYAAIGPELIRYEADIIGGFLSPREITSMPLDIQYIWRHPDIPMAYLAISNGGPGKRGNDNRLIACRLDDSEGATLFGPSAALPSRPLHLSLDRQNAHILAAYNDPSSLTVHQINSDGAIGARVHQSTDLDFGIFGHQIMVTPDNKAAILPCRGHDAEGNLLEQPGALKIFGYENGILSNKRSIAPNGGNGFGARHLDFHPTKPWLFLGIERQSELHVYEMAHGDVRPEPLHVITTLERDNSGPARQAFSAIHVHPNGRFVYVSNRAYGVPHKPITPDGENSITVFKIDPRTAEPIQIQHAPTRGHLPRTFSIDTSGSMLVAANSERTQKLNLDGEPYEIDISLVAYRIGEDGRLTETNQVDFPGRSGRLFWAGFL